MIFIKKKTYDRKQRNTAYLLFEICLYFKLNDFYPQKARTPISVLVTASCMWVFFVQYACPVHQVSNYFT